jgi:hypothetical protein
MRLPRDGEGASHLNRLQPRRRSLPVPPEAGGCPGFRGTRHARRSRSRRSRALRQPESRVVDCNVPRSPVARPGPLQGACGIRPELTPATGQVRRFRYGGCARHPCTCVTTRAPRHTRLLLSLGTWSYRDHDEALCARVDADHGAG